MANSFSKEFFSGSTNGLGIKISATSGTGTTVHTATSTSGEKDEVWLYAVNESDVSVNLIVQWGGTTDVDNTMTVGVPPKSGQQLIVPGFVVNGGVVIRAYASTADVIVVYGFVNRIVSA